MLFQLFADPATLIFFVVAIVIAITVHESAHALVSNLLGDRTAKEAGRLTLNPLAHLDPLGTLMLFIAGFGWGRPVPYNPYHLRGGRFAEFLVAIAGPLSNLLFASLAALPGRLYLAQSGTLPQSPLFTFLAIVVTINIILAVFNLLPVPPLDGSKLLYPILGRPGISPVTTRLEQIGPIILLSLILLERLFNVSIIFRLLEPLIIFAQWLTGGVTLPF